MDPIPVSNTYGKVFFSTPMTIIGIFVAILQERFTETTPSEPPLEWFWTPDLKTTGVFIESGFNVSMEARNTRPGIWVDRTQTTYGEVSVGNRDQMPAELRSGFQQYYATAETDMAIDCTSARRGESMMVGSIVQDFLQMSAQEIMKSFGLRDISPILLNRTVPYEKDRDLMNSEIVFRVSYEARWASLPIAAVMRGINLRLQDEDDPELYFRRIALRDK